MKPLSHIWDTHAHQVRALGEAVVEKAKGLAQEAAEFWKNTGLPEDEETRHHRDIQQVRANTDKFLGRADENMSSGDPEREAKAVKSLKGAVKVIDSDVFPQKHAQARLRLAQAHMEGRGVDKGDLTKAHFHLKKALNLGSAEAAQTMRALENRVRDEVETQKNLDRPSPERLARYQKLLTHIAEDNANYGRTRLFGDKDKGVESQPEEAIRIFEEVLEATGGENMKAQEHLGRIFMNGNHAKQDYGRAFAHFAEMDDHGDPLAELMLSWLDERIEDDLSRDDLDETVKSEHERVQAQIKARLQPERALSRHEAEAKALAPSLEIE